MSRSGFDPRVNEERIENQTTEDLLQTIIIELRIMNFHLNKITDCDIKEEDIRNAD